MVGQAGVKLSNRGHPDDAYGQSRLSGEEETTRDGVAQKIVLSVSRLTHCRDTVDDPGRRCFWCLKEC